MNIAIKEWPFIVLWIYPLNIMIFYSYLGLPEDISGDMTVIYDMILEAVFSSIWVCFIISCFDMDLPVF